METTRAQRTRIQETTRMCPPFFTLTLVCGDLCLYEDDFFDQNVYTKMMRLRKRRRTKRILKK